MVPVITSATTGPLILRVRPRGQIIDALRKSHPGRWRYVPREHVWRRDDGRVVQPRSHFAPRYDFNRAFSEYLIPTIRTRYENP